MEQINLFKLQIVDIYWKSFYDEHPLFQASYRLTEEQCYMNSITVFNDPYNTLLLSKDRYAKWNK